MERGEDRGTFLDHIHNAGALCPDNIEVEVGVKQVKGYRLKVIGSSNEREARNAQGESGVVAV